MLSEILLVLAIVGVVWAWMHTLAVKDLANTAAKRHCQQMGVQFLDGTVALGGAKPTWSGGDGLRLAQRFTFEFTVTGEKRYHGEVQFIGKRQVHLFLEPHVIEDDNGDFH